MNRIPDKYEHLVRYYGYYSNRSRGARLIQKVYEVDRLECPDCRATLRIIALIDDPDLCGVFFIRRMSGNGRSLPYDASVSESPDCLLLRAKLPVRIWFPKSFLGRRLYTQELPVRC